MDQLKAQLVGLKQNEKALKESNSKIHELATELETVRAGFETLRATHDEKLKKKSQSEKGLSEANLKASTEIELLQAQLTEALTNSMHLKARNDELKVWVCYMYFSN
jgi:hypothetical protein